MSGWRGLLACAAAVVAAVAALGVAVSPAVAALPALAAAAALTGAALAGDYFGLARRRRGWDGTVEPTAARRLAAAALAQRFERARRSGGLGAGAAGRALLLALAEQRSLDRAGDVVDFLSAEAQLRPHADVVADALRALALAELGRPAQARAVLDGLRRHEATPVVALATARLAERERRWTDGLRATDRALGDRPRRGARRDLAVARARLLAGAGRLEDARRELARLADDGGRGAVEALVVEADGPVALAARQALGAAAAYR